MLQVASARFSPWVTGSEVMLFKRRDHFHDKETGNGDPGADGPASQVDHLDPFKALGYPPPVARQCFAVGAEKLSEGGWNRFLHLGVSQSEGIPVPGFKLFK